MLAPDQLADPTCPICGATITAAQGFYDKLPHYRCRSCGYELKPRNPLVFLLAALAVLMVLGVITFYVGRAAATGPTTSFHINSLF